jgi:hypothetical protein
LLNNGNEIIVESDADPTFAVSLIKIMAEDTAKLYGPIFTRMVSEYALQFEAEKLKEKPPQNIQGLEAVANYITRNLERYLRGYCSLLYGIGKTESILEGSSGPGSKRSAYSITKTILQSSGMLNNLIGTTEDIFEALDKFEKAQEATKTATPLRFIKGENNQVTKISNNCSFKDVCRALAKEGVSRLVGGKECVTLIAHTAAVEIITKKTFDYKLDEFDKPECKGRIFEV